MTLINVVYCLTLLQMLICIIWRIICFFRKKGNCKFTKCPFRKNFYSTSYMELEDKISCDKCLPTIEEIEEGEKILRDLEDYIKKDIFK